MKILIAKIILGLTLSLVVSILIVEPVALYTLIVLIGALAVSLLLDWAINVITKEDL